MAIDLAVLPGFVAVILLFLAPPGPDMAFIIAVGLGSGRRAAARAILGIATGMSVYAGAVVIGVGEMAQAYPLVLDAVKVAGALYLLWLAFVTVRGIKRATADGGASAAGRPYLRGVSVSLTNPKVILFFLAVLPQFVGDASNPTLQLAMLGVVNVLTELILYGAIGLLAGSFQARLIGSKTATVALQYLSAAVYFGLAIFVLVDAARSLTTA